MYEMQKQKYKEKTQTKTGNLMSQRKLEERNTAMQFRPADFHGITNIQRKKNETGLPDDLKSGLESASGFTMDDVRVHYNSEKPAKMQAYAYTQGTNIHVAPGQERYLPHEAWHVVQQKQGRVQPTINLNGVQINYNVGLEQEAEAMGQKVLQGKFKENEKKAASPENKTVQRALVKYVGGREKENRSGSIRVSNGRINILWVKAKCAGWGNSEGQCLKKVKQKSVEATQSPILHKRLDGPIDAENGSRLWLYGNVEGEKNVVTSYIVRHKHSIRCGKITRPGAYKLYEEDTNSEPKEIISGSGQLREVTGADLEAFHYHCAGIKYLRKYLRKYPEYSIGNDKFRIEYSKDNEFEKKRIVDNLSEGAGGSTEHHVFNPLDLPLQK